MPSALSAAIPAGAESPQAPLAAGQSFAVAGKLTPPENGVIPVACLISDGAVLVDFAGPWEVFDNVSMGNRMGGFRLYAVSETAKPIQASGGMQIVPDYTLQTAPAPKVIVIPAQSNSNAAVLDWIRKASQNADVTMSVCTGAYLLAETGLLAGKAATTHHGSYVDFAAKYPDVHVKRGVRFVEVGNLATSGGLFCGMDLALRVVERYYGREVAAQTAFDLEYQGQGWLHPESNAAYLKVRTTANNHPLCVVCSMEYDPAIAPSRYKGHAYYFCSAGHKEQFDAAPDKFVAVIEKQ